MALSSFFSGKRKGRLRHWPKMKKVMFSGVYDHCPIWRALAPRVAAIFKG
jgi:hypothetical protein